MTDAMNVMLTRRSVKSYRSDPVPRDLLEQIDDLCAERQGLLDQQKLCEDASPSTATS